MCRNLRTLVGLVGVLMMVIVESRNRVYVWDTLNCTANKKFISNLHCFIRAEDHKTMTIQGSFLKDISNIKMKVKIRIVSYKNGQAETKPVVDQDINICALLQGGQKNYFVGLLHDVLHQYSNLPKKCPLQKNNMYILRNLTIDGNLIPPFLPDNEFNADFIMFTPSKGPLISATIAGRLTTEEKT